MTREQILEEMNDINMALACDESTPSTSLSYSYAVERLQELEQLLKTL